MLSSLPLLPLILFAACTRPTRSQDWSDEHPTVEQQSSFNTTYISQVLNRLTDRSRYDKRLRPHYGEGKVDVGITVHVSSISAVSEVDMDFTLDFYLRQTWHDPRLAFGKLDTRLDTGFERIKSLTVGIDYLDRLWKPDTFFPNEKKSFFHTSTTHNSFLRIDPDGKVSISQRLTVTATCPMELRLFPMDSQRCKLEIESYGYADHDIDMYWGANRLESREPHKAVRFEEFSLPQFRRGGYRVNTTKATTASGVYVRLYFEILLSRNIGFYLMNIIIPSMLIVSISWVSFWLSREASPARVGLGVTTVLTMTTLITTTNNAMPKVSYIKGLDVFLNFCFVMVFASLVEYAVVAYWSKKEMRNRERRRKREHADGPTPSSPQQPVEMPMFTNYPITPSGGLAITPPPPSTSIIMGKGADYVYRAPSLLGSAPHALGGPTTTASVSLAMPPDCDCRTIPLHEFTAYQSASPPAALQMVSPHAFLNARQRRRLMKASGYSVVRSHGSGALRRYCCGRLSPSKIDRCSRSLFPLLFICFNCVYWSVLTYLSQMKANQKDFVYFNES